MWTRWRRHKGQLAQQHAEQQAFQERVEASLAAVVEMLVPERSSKVEQLEERIERLESVAVWSQSPQDLPATSELQVQQLANCSRVQVEAACLEGFDGMSSLVTRELGAEAWLRMVSTHRTHGLAISQL